MIQKKIFISLIAVLMVFALASVAMAAVVGKAVVVKGKVSYLPNNQIPGKPLAPGTSLSEGDLIRVSDRSYAEIEFSDGSKIEIHEKSRLGITKPGKFDLNLGKIVARVEKKKTPHFEVRTPIAAAGVRGTTFSVTHNVADNKTVVAVQEGTVWVKNTTGTMQEVELQKGYLTTVQPQLPPAEPAKMRESDAQHFFPAPPKPDQTSTNTQAPIVTQPISESIPETLGDRTAPAVAFVVKPAVATQSVNALFTMSANEPVSYEYSVDGGAYQSLVSNNVNLVGLGEGNHTITVKAMDVAGNASTSTYNWIVDLTAPTASFTAGPANAGFTATSPSYTIGGSDTATAISTYEYSIDGGAYTSDADGVINVGALADGTYTVNVRVRDAAGNVSAPVSRTITIDATNPTNSYASSPLPVVGSALAGANTFSASVTDSNADFVRYDVDGATTDVAVVAGSAAKVVAPQLGLNTISITPYDKAGNVGTTASYSYWYGDRAYTLASASSKAQRVDPTDGVGSLVADGILAVRSDNQAGGWYLKLTGPYTAMPANRTFHLGGAATGGDPGIWYGLANLTSNAGDLTGNASLIYFGDNYMGITTAPGTLSGTYGANVYTMEAKSLGGYTEYSLLYSLRNAAPTNIVSVSNGVAGQVIDMRLGYYETLAFASYAAPVNLQGLIRFDFAGDTTARAALIDMNGSSFEGWTAFKGYTGFAVKDTTTSDSTNVGYNFRYVGLFHGAGESGIVIGKSGLTTYRDIAIGKLGGGSAYPVVLVGAGAIGDDTTWSLSPNISIVPDGAGVFNAGGTLGINNLTSTATYLTQFNDAATAGFGISKMDLRGTYAGATFDGGSGAWKAGISSSDANSSWVGQVQGTKWLGNEIEGTIAYAGIKHATGQTYIGSSDLVGTYSATKWAAVAAGVSMETMYFLNTACPGGVCNTNGVYGTMTADQQKLVQLNIPVVEVGRANFTVSLDNLAGDAVNMFMSNSVFFSRQGSTSPEVFASKNISGSYTGTPGNLVGTGFATANMTSPAFSSAPGKFTLDSWNANKWTGSITPNAGAHTYVGAGAMNSTQINGIKGVAAGTYDGANNITGGTAAGVVVK